MNIQQENIAEMFTEEVIHITLRGVWEAILRQSGLQEPEDLSLALLKATKCVAVVLLKQAQVDIDLLIMKLTPRPVRQPLPHSRDMEASPELRQSFELAAKEAYDLNDAYIGTEHLLLGLLDEGTNRMALRLWQEGVTAELIRQLVIKERGESAQGGNDVSIGK